MAGPLVYRLPHVHWHDGETCAKLIGFYRDRAEAARARERATVLPGFNDAPDDFIIDAFAVGEDHWIGGVAGWSPGFKVKPTQAADEASAAPLEIDRVFVLYHACEFVDVWLDDDARTVGVYATRAEADAAQARAAQRAGFRDASDAFIIDATCVGEDRWTAGYVTT